MQIDDLRVALAVGEFKSIKRAAESLDLSTATASASLKRTEQYLGVELFVRSTRSLRLSTAGERYLPKLEQMLLTVDEIKQNVKGDLDIVEGELRLAVPSDLGRNYIITWLDEFMASHPGVKVKVHISDSNIDFYRDPVDIALRYGSPSDASTYGFKICHVPRVLCASPSYIEHYGSPTSLSHLAKHNALLYQLGDVIHDVWSFIDTQGKATKVKVTGDRASNDADLVRRWCVAGKGIATKSALDMSDDLLCGNLVTLLQAQQPKSGELWLICPSRQLITPAVRKLREFVTTKCEEILTQLSKHGHIQSVPTRR